MTSASSPHLRPRDGTSQPTTPVELLFDLVYAFAVTQISHLLIDDITPTGNLTLTGTVHAVFLLFVVWWAWIYTTWMVNWFDPVSSRVRLVVVVAALASLLMAAAIPTAFTANPVLFAGAYVTLQIGRNVSAAALLDRDHALRPVLDRITAWSLASGALWLAGAFVAPSLRLVLWAPALAIELVAPLVGYRTPGRGASTTMDYPVDGGHFAERFQSFLIIVLGESIIVTGATASARGLTASTVVGLGLAFVITGALWWLYFGTVAEHSRELLASAADPAQLARDAYSYIHLPIVTGVIMVAVGDDLLLAGPGRALSWSGVAMLAGGPALFLAGEVLFRVRMTGSISPKRVIACVLLCLLAVLLRPLPALVVAGAVSLLLTGLAVWEYDALALPPMPVKLRRQPEELAG
ncbi:MAG: low temperature requirement protein A [Solirubrobacteraceae bacterium]